MSMKSLVLEKNQKLSRSWKDYSSELLVFHEKKFLKEKEKELAKKFSENYFSIKNKEIRKNITSIFQILKEGKVDVIVPMKEKDGTIKNFLDYATKRMPPSSILIVNDRSSKKSLNTVRKFKNVILVDKDKILETIKWDKLLPLLNLSQKPKGKGVAVFAGYLFWYFLSKLNLKNTQWIFQTDADIKNHRQFKPLEYLAWGIVKNPGSIHIKMAKGGRNNEPNMAVRCAVAVLEDLEQITENEIIKEIGKRAGQLFENLAKYKWILSGTFALSTKIASDRPFATGYLDETLVCAFVEDVAKKKNSFSVQVSNPNPCFDKENSFEKENIIVQMTANFIITLALARKPISEWTLEDIAWINKNLMSKPRKITLIPPKGNEGPVMAKVVGNERIIPSLKMLEAGGFIDEKKFKINFPKLDSSLKNP